MLTRKFNYIGEYGKTAKQLNLEPKMIQPIETARHRFQALQTTRILVLKRQLALENLFSIPQNVFISISALDYSTLQNDPKKGQ